MLIEITYNVTDVYMSTTETPVYVEISFEQPGGSAAVWGSITGTLSNQTDLQNALNAKLDESTIDGGTEGQILSKASATDFDFAWINNYAKYLATNVRNQTGSTIGAFQVVYISGATGNKPLISLADADTEATSSKTYGVTATSIANNGTGDVVTAGELSGIDTSAFNEGDLLWLSTTAGGVVTSPPAEPAHAVFIGYVVRSHPTLGVIDVSIANGYELNELHGVQINTPTDNQGLFYNSTSTLWENKSITTALGYTPVPTTRNITINGVTYDLSADRTWTISTGISGSGASGQVTYWTGSSAVSGSNNLFWDNTNGRLGIGTNAPATLLDVYSSVNSNSSLQVGASQNVRISINTQSANRFGILSISRIGDGGTPAVNIGVGTGPTSTSGIISAGNDNLIFGYNIGNTFTETFRINTLNRLLLGFTTDQAVKLAVNGDTLLRGSGNTSATTALTVQNSSSTNLLTVRNDGYTTVQAVSSTANLQIGNFLINNITTSGITTFSMGSRNSFFEVAFAGGGYSWTFRNTSNIVDTSGLINHFNLTATVAPTSGTLAFNLLNLNPTINQTGGANGITRGLYVNPTLTAAADFRAIETSAGNVLFGSNFFWDNTNGRLGIGTNAPASALTVSGNLTGSTSYNLILANGAVQSGVTSSASYYFTSASTQAASFNLTSLRHYIAVQGTFGAGSTVATQSGFVAHSSLIGASNNYGFYGLIPSGGGRFNLYMEGTADNYLAGNLGIGITPTVKLHVSGDTILKGSGATSSTTALTVQNSSSTNLFTVRNDGISKFGSSSYFDVSSPLIVGTDGAVGARISIANNSNYQDFMFVNTSIASGNINNWSFGQRRDTYFGNSIGSFQIVGAYANNSGSGSTVGGGYRVPLICNPNGDVLILGANANVVNGLIGLKVNAPTAHVDITASTTGNASLRIRSGTAPTTPNDGDIWFDGTDIKMRIGGVTKTFTLI